MKSFKQLNLDLHSLVVFHNLTHDKVLIRLSRLLESMDSPPLERVRCYSSFVSQLYLHGDNLTDYVLGRVLQDENIYVLRFAHLQPVDQALRQCVVQELKKLEDISLLRADDVCKQLDYEGYLPMWNTSSIDFDDAYHHAIHTIATRGYGIFADHHMFVLHNGAVSPVQYPDPIRLAGLAGYEVQRREVIDNTLALIDGRPAANVLLYGDAGTGKSSTVKAIVNEYASQGLRLIELSKSQLREIPSIIGQLCENPLKFILFIDDLSFSTIGDDFNALKAILEGSASAKTPGVAIYATSNRRHLIKEQFSDRAGDDIHVNETIQELCSLSDRFGLSVRFFQPDKHQYLEIVLSLKAQYGISMEDAQLCLEAEQFATERGGRSPRAARQFMDRIKSMELSPSGGMR